MPPPAAVPAPCSSRLFRLLRAFSAVNPPGVSPPGSRVFCFLGCGMEQRGCGGEDARSGAVAPPVLLNLPDPLPEGFLGRSVRGSSLLYPRSSERSLQRRKSGKCRKKATGAPPCPLPDCPSSFPAAGSVPSTGSAREVRPEEDAAPRGEPLLRGKGRVTPKSRPFLSQPGSSSIYLEHLILIIGRIQPSNWGWGGGRGK